MTMASGAPPAHAGSSVPSARKRRAAADVMVGDSPGQTAIQPDHEFSTRPIGTGPMRGSKGRREVRFTAVPNAHHNPQNGDGLQETTAWHGKGGLMVWRKADNFTAFTDGYRTWITRHRSTSCWSTKPITRAGRTLCGEPGSTQSMATCSEPFANT